MLLLTPSRSNHLTCSLSAATRSSRPSCPAWPRWRLGMGYLRRLRHARTGGRRPYELRNQHLIEAYRQKGVYVGRIIKGDEPSRPAGRAGNQIRTRHQARDCRKPRPRSPLDAARPRRRGDRMIQRREFITLLGGAAASLAAVRRGRSRQRCPSSVSSKSDHLRQLRSGCARFVRASKKPAMSRARTWRSTTAGPSSPERLPEVAAQLARRQVAVVATAGGFATALAGKGCNEDGDPHRVRRVSDDRSSTVLVASLARPGGNLTGVNLLSTGIDGKAAPAAARNAAEGLPASSCL